MEIALLIVFIVGGIAWLLRAAYLFRKWDYQKPSNASQDDDS